MMQADLASHLSHLHRRTRTSETLSTVHVQVPEHLKTGALGSRESDS